MGCVDPDRAVTEVRLNASAPFEPDALFLSVMTSLLSALIIFKALVDSGSTHCFVDPRFIATNNLITYSVTPIRLKLFNGTSNKENPISDPRPSMRATVSDEMEPQTIPDNSDSDTREDNPTPNIPETPETPTATPKVDISLVNAVAYLRACELPGTQQFTLNLKDFSARASSTSQFTPVDLSSIPEEYHDFADVFDKVKADTLAPHQPYDLKINLAENSTPPLGHMYSLSQTELVTL